MENKNYKFKSNPCCLCGNTKKKVVFPYRMDGGSYNSYAFSARRERNIQHYRIVKCSTCGLIRSDPVIPYEATIELYRNSKFLYEKESDLIALKYLKLIKKYIERLSKKSHILEIGCGNGALLYLLLKNGYVNIEGVEPSFQAVERSHRLITNRIIKKPFDSSLYPEQSFAFIANFHLLDHLHDPSGFLLDCRKLLKRRGMLFIACHNERALSARLLGEKSPIYDIEHVFLFEKVTLKKLLEVHGFDVITIKTYWNTYPFEYWIRMLSFLRKYQDLIPNSLKKVKLTLPAGNMYALAIKI